MKTEGLSRGRGGSRQGLKAGPLAMEFRSGILTALDFLTAIWILLVCAAYFRSVFVAYGEPALLRLLSLLRTVWGG